MPLKAATFNKIRSFTSSTHHFSSYLLTSTASMSTKSLSNARFPHKWWPQCRIEARDHQTEAVNVRGHGPRGGEDSPERRMVSRTRMACSSQSGRVCSSPVHTRACASSTVAFGRGSPAGRYESYTAGFLRRPSSSTATPASSIHDAAVAATPRRHPGPPTETTEPSRLGACETRRLRLGLGSGLRRREFMVSQGQRRRPPRRGGRRRALQGRKNRGGVDRFEPSEVNGLGPPCIGRGGPAHPTKPGWGPRLPARFEIRA